MPLVHEATHAPFVRTFVLREDRESQTERNSMRACTNGSLGETRSNALTENCWLRGRGEDWMWLANVEVSRGNSKKLPNKKVRPTSHTDRQTNSLP